MKFSDLSEEDKDFYESMNMLDELAAKAGGYVEECYDIPRINIRAVDKEIKRVGRPLTDEEFEKFKTDYD